MCIMSILPGLACLFSLFCFQLKMKVCKVYEILSNFDEKVIICYFRTPE